MHQPQFLLDLDGVLYRGDQAIPEAVLFLDQIRGFPHLFVSNNSSVTPDDLAAKLGRLGLQGVDASQIVTSALATANYLRSKKGAFRYYAVGGPGLHSALQAVGSEDLQNPDYVVVGEGGGLSYQSLTLGINLLLKGNAELIATNPDANLDGTWEGRAAVLPGGGALVAPFAVASGRDTIFVGKPEPHLFLEALQRLGGSPEQTIMIGDRPDTDILGAARLGFRTALVRTGRFGPDQPYPAHVPRPDWDLASLNDWDLSQLPWAL